MENKYEPPVMAPGIDLADALQDLMGDTGDLRGSMGGFRIKVHHRAFPWAEIFKALLYRDFRIAVTRNQADIVIEATP